MGEIHKILVVAYYDSSRDAAYKVGNSMREHGYSTDLCHREPDDDQEFSSKIQPDLYLNKDLPLSAYCGVIFIDDGGDPKSCKHIAAAASEADIVLGGYRHGCEILYMAGLLKEEFIPAGMPADWNGKAKLVDAPAVRSNNIVTCVSGCPDGFAVLMVDALGGEVKKTVESSKAPIPIRRSALVVAPISKWADYWKLSERLAEKNAVLLIADFSDIDIENASLRKCLAIGPQIENKAKLIKSPVCIPASLWFQQTDVEAAGAVESLEAIGCKNVNSSEAIRLASNKMLISSILNGDIKKFNDSTIDDAVSILTSGGIRLVKTALREPISVQAGPHRTIVSKLVGSEEKHFAVDREELRQILKKRSNRGEFMVQTDQGILSLGGEKFSIYYLMRRQGKQWAPAACLAKSRNVVCDGRHVIKAFFGDGWEQKDAANMAKALTACSAFENELKTGMVNELGIEISVTSSDPEIMDITATPDLSMTDNGNFTVIASGLGIEAPPVPTSNPQAEIEPYLRPAMPSRGEQDKKRNVERELSYQGLWPQLDGRIAMEDGDGIHVRTKADTIKIINFDIKEFLQKFGENDRIDDVKASRYGRLIRRCLLRLKLLHELDSMTVKTAGYLDEQDGEYDYEGTVPGPYSNVQVPQRVLKWREGDDWLHDIPGMDDQTIANLSRYHPDSKDGFYAEFDLWHNNDPIPWGDVEKGQGNYPSRSQLIR